jgi:hypothetical protein
LKTLWVDFAAASLISTKEDLSESTTTTTTLQKDASSAPVVTCKLIETLLLRNGEFERAKDVDLIQKMVDVCKSPSGLLDEQAFLNALTFDLKEWEVGCEDRRSTYVEDVFGAEEFTTTFERWGKVEEEQAVAKQEQAEEDEDHVEDPDDDAEEEAGDKHVLLSKKRSGRIIDSVVDSYASSATLLLIWLFYLSMSSIYSSLLKASGVFDANCKRKERDDEVNESFGCTLLATLYTWYGPIV